jgi:Ca-activated chloride channel family protein
LGLGYGNLKDNKLETLANSAFEGNYAYIDNILEARKVLVEEIGGTLVTVARDVKAQVLFNPEKVHSYRLLGYENKLITNEEWDDKDKIAGDIGAGHCVTAAYEIILNADGGQDGGANGGFLKASVRYKDPSDNADREISRTVDSLSEANADILFISAVVEAALVMRESVYKGNASIQNVIARLETIEALSTDPYKAEFLELMNKLKNIY